MFMRGKFMGTNKFVENVQEAAKNIAFPEQILGKGLNIPNNATSSGARKLMNNIHQSHSLVLCEGDMPFVSTGYENRFGDLSSSIIKTDCDMEILGVIPKFSSNPMQHYYVIVRNLTTGEISHFERISYKYVTEMYGYMYNNDILDHYVTTKNYIIPKGTVVRRSVGFDIFGNKANGRNLNIVYLALDNNMEDSVVISESCSKKMSAPLVKTVKIIINENDIPLNIYGDENTYKSFPDVGEDIQNATLFAYRRERIEDAIYTQSVQRLQEIMMSDDRVTMKGVVHDINIYCNNPEYISQNIYNGQIYSYYQDRLRVDREIIEIVGPYITAGDNISYDLQKLFMLAQDELGQKKFIDKKQFSNIMIEFVVVEQIDLGIGGKISDRYGGKGVVSKILPDHMMPSLPNGLPVEMIKNSSTMYNRENAGQIFELEVNYISMCILDRIRNTPDINIELALGEILKFLEIQSPKQYVSMKRYTDKLNSDELTRFIDSLLSFPCIHVSNDPLSETMDIDKLGRLYRAFPYIKQVRLVVPIKGSNGDIRFIQSKNPTIAAPQYCLRLKQLAEEKFSATSLSSTNLKNENVKSKASKNYRSPNSNTPIKFGYMESGDLMHMGTEYVVLNLLLHSLSPSGRRLMEQLATGDPYNVDVKIDSRSKNRSAEILNTRLKTMGYRIIFDKIDKPAPKPAISFSNNPNGMRALVTFHSKDYDIQKYYDTLEEIKRELNKHDITFDVINFS